MMKLQLQSCTRIGLATAILLYIFITIEIFTIDRRKPAPATVQMIQTDDISSHQNPDTDYNDLDMMAISNPLFCPMNRRPAPSSIIRVHSNWQVEINSRGSVYIYSVYFDDRPLAGFLPHLRLLTLATFQPNMSAYCHVWYESLEQPLITEAEINETGMNRYWFDDIGYFEYTYSCPLPLSYPIPTHVSLTVDRQCGHYSTYKRVSFVPRGTPKFDFGVCVANGHGYFKPEVMIEWFELNMLFGIKEFNLYDTMYANQTDVFRHYVNKGVLRVHQLYHPLNTTESWYEKVRNLRTVALNDCMMRNMYRYRYLVVVDHDEIIVPRNANNYSLMLQEAEQRIREAEPNLNATVIHSLSFYNAYFLASFPEDVNKPSFLRTLRFRKRAEPSDRYVGSKSFINPLFCFNLMNHYCYVRLPLYRGPVTSFVPPEVALSHHYRKCGSFLGITCDELHAQQTSDHVMLKFERNLTARVKPVLNELGISV